MMGKKVAVARHHLPVFRMSRLDMDPSPTSELLLSSPLGLR